MLRVPLVLAAALLLATLAAALPSPAFKFRFDGSLSNAGSQAASYPAGVTLDAANAPQFITLDATYGYAALNLSDKRSTFEIVGFGTWAAQQTAITIWMHMSESIPSGGALDDLIRWQTSTGGWNTYKGASNVWTTCLQGTNYLTCRSLDLTAQTTSTWHNLTWSLQEPDAASSTAGAFKYSFNEATSTLSLPTTAGLFLSSGAANLQVGDSAGVEGWAMLDELMIFGDALSPADVTSCDCAGGVEPGNGPPTKLPTRQPTKLPTKLPTRQPTRLPTVSPTRMPSVSPTMMPTVLPTAGTSGGGSDGGGSDGGSGDGGSGDGGSSDGGTDGSTEPTGTQSPGTDSDTTVGSDSSSATPPFTTSVLFYILVGIGGCICLSALFALILCLSHRRAGSTRSTAARAARSHGNSRRSSYRGRPGQPERVSARGERTSTHGEGGSEARRSYGRGRAGTGGGGGGGGHLANPTSSAGFVPAKTTYAATNFPPSVSRTASHYQPPSTPPTSANSLMLQRHATSPRFVHVERSTYTSLKPTGFGGSEYPYSTSDVHGDDDMAIDAQYPPGPPASYGTGRVFTYQHPGDQYMNLSEL